MTSEPHGILTTGSSTTATKLSNAQQAWMKEYAKYQVGGGESPPPKRVSFNDVPLVLIRSPSMVREESVE